MENFELHVRRRINFEDINDYVTTSKIEHLGETNSIDTYLRLVFNDVIYETLTDSFINNSRWNDSQLIMISTIIREILIEKYQDELMEFFKNRETFLPKKDG